MSEGDRAGVFKTIDSARLGVSAFAPRMSKLLSHTAGRETGSRAPHIVIKYI